MELRLLGQGEPPRALVGSPAVRRRKQTRCRHCLYCHQQGRGAGLRLCTHPQHSGPVVVGDQFVCADYRAALGDGDAA